MPQQVDEADRHDTDQRGSTRNRAAPSIAAMVAIYVVALFLVLLFQVGSFVPVGAALALGLLGWVLAAPRFGLIAAVVTPLLLPETFAFNLGPFAVSIGRMVGFVFIAGWVAALSRRGGPLLRRTPFDLPILFVVFSYGLSIAANASFFNGPEFGDAWQATARVLVDFFAFFYAAVSVMGASREHLERVLRVVALTVGAIAAIGVTDWITQRNVFEFTAGVFPSGLGRQVRTVAQEAVRERGGLRRAMGTFEQPNQLGAALTVALPFLIHFAAWPGEGRRRWPYLVGAGLTALAGILTISRSVVVTLVVGLVVYFMAVGAVRSRRAAGGAVIGVISIALIASPALRDTIFIYFEGFFTGQERSVESRLKDYENVLAQFDRTPAAGSGPSTWSPRALRRPGVERVDQSDKGQLVLDNLGLSSLAERGAVGLMSLLALLAVPIAVLIRAVRRARAPDLRSLRAAALASLCAYAVLTALFDMFAFYGPTKLYFLFLAAAAVAAGRTVAYVPPSHPVPIAKDHS